jgi:hypothetical protein
MDDDSEHGCNGDNEYGYENIDEHDLSTFSRYGRTNALPLYRVVFAESSGPSS